MVQSASFIEDVRRRVEAGEHTAALNGCPGVVLGLYRLRDKSRDKFLGWAADAPHELACEAVVTLRKALLAFKAPQAAGAIPAILRQSAPDWADILEHCWRRPS